MLPSCWARTRSPSKRSGRVLKPATDNSPPGPRGRLPRRRGPLAGRGGGEGGERTAHSGPRPRGCVQEAFPEGAAGIHVPRLQERAVNSWGPTGDGEGGRRATVHARAHRAVRPPGQAAC